MKNTIKIYEDDTLVGLLTGIVRPSANPKTGPMLQLFILGKEDKPTALMKARTDGVHCGACPLKHGRGCYVNWIGANAVWEAGVDQPVTDLGDIQHILARSHIRLGAAGDPGLLPFSFLLGLASMCRGWTGYTHQWLAPGFDHDMAHLLMYSVDPIQADRHGTDVNGMAAMVASHGARAFIAHRPGDTPDAVTCPNTTHGVQCIDCGLCAGQWRGATHISIQVHGSPVAQAVFK